jgi:PilZ domain-containing protein
MTLVERRKHPRFPCDLSVEIKPEDQTITFTGTLADICLGGCFVSTVSPLPAGTSVVLVFQPNGEPGVVTRLAGRTVTCHPGNGMGIEFTGAEDAHVALQLKSLIAALDGDTQDETRAPIKAIG